ncbi:hypothetical protein B0H14DRAFT_3755598 [Mycena olivaceomarginata]|nr:hypothetical protein B0H14DRAFT_3755598 [Mycena olivaceomarginata]
MARAKAGDSTKTSGCKKRGADASTEATTLMPNPQVPVAAEIVAADKTVPKELQKDPFKNNPDKTTAMVTAIGENEPYHNKLYPPPGQNQSTTEGGGLSKASIYWELFKLLWGNDYPKFVKYLERGKAKEREVITDKIKYRLTALEKETKKIRKDMKQTGEGNKMTQQELNALPEDDERRSAWGA